jgi:uncharacterized protein (TIGR03067 family)
MWRVAVSLVVVLALTAFAPAPFLRKKRDGGPISLKGFQGKWRWAKVQDVVKGGVLKDSNSGRVTHVRIAGKRWTFLPDNYPGANLDIAIDTTKSPAQLTFYQPTAPGKVYGVGLIRRQGGSVQVLYTWGGEERRPKSFEKMPVGYWLSTFIRD